MKKLYKVNEKDLVRSSFGNDVKKNHQPPKTRDIEKCDTCGLIVCSTDHEIHLVSSKHIANKFNGKKRNQYVIYVLNMLLRAFKNVF